MLRVLALLAFSLVLLVPASAAQTDIIVGEVDIRVESATLRSGPVRIVGQAGQATPMVSGPVSVWADVWSSLVVPSSASSPVEVSDVENDVATPAEVALHTVYPNPSARAARVRYELPDAAQVRLTVYDALGREVLVAVDGERPGGAHDAALDVGRLAPGVYHLRLSVGASTHIRSFVVSR